MESTGDINPFDAPDGSAASKTPGNGAIAAASWSAFYSAGSVRD